MPDGGSEGVPLECERSPLSDDWGTLFTCTYSAVDEIPASTPFPTDVPVERVAQDFCRSAESLEYGVEMAVLLWNIDAAAERLIDIIELVADNDGPLSTDLSARISTEMDQFERHVTKLTELRPPKELQPAYQLLQQLAVELMDFSAALQTGIFQNSSEDIYEAIEHWERARDLRASYDERMQELCTS